MESGARAAISGFRRQSLYALDLLIQEATSGRELEPEGAEDLAVYERGVLVGVVQVKAYSAPLTLSDLEPRRKDSFLRRLLQREDSIWIHLVSFGPLGAELEALRQRDHSVTTHVAAKLRDQGYAENDAAAILARLQLLAVDEAAIEKRVLEFLTHTLTSGEPRRAFDLLVWWLLQAAEGRRRLSLVDLSARIVAVGRYFAERASHHEEWFSTIKPLMDSDAPTPPFREQLEREYYMGAAARYSHVAAGLDVSRREHLDRLEELFGAGKRIVILHGASGQGKTTLALRYLHDAVPEDWRFLVAAIEDRPHAARIAHAIADHLHGMDSPIFLLIDVAPRDLEWVALVRELLDIDKVRILVAIREEDLARRTASDHEIGFPADLRLDFSETEARQIYAQLMQRSAPANAFPSFAEAWERFGGRGPLLEFVYLVTQTESLRSVLRRQVRRLQEEVQSGVLEPGVLRLLHRCALATSFEARIRLRPLEELLSLRDPAGAITLLENEYLVRISPDRTQAEALHAVRSRLLAEAFDDPAYAPSGEEAVATIRCIPEPDLEVFVLHLLSRFPSSWEKLRQALSTHRVRTWAGASGLARALLWWGTKRYLDANRDVLNEVEEVGGESWRQLLLGDLAGAVEADPVEAIFDLLEKQSPAAAPRARRLRELRAGLLPSSNIFAPLQHWLQTLALDSMPQSSVDWQSFAELTFWAGRLKVPPPRNPALTPLPVESLPVEILAQISWSLASIAPELQRAYLSQHAETLLQRLREDNDILILEERDEAVTAHFLVRLELLGLAGDRAQPPARAATAQRSSAVAPQPVIGSRNLQSLLNDEAVRRAGLLHALLPGRSHYGTQGHGHLINLGGIGLPNDETIKHMPPAALPLPWLTRANAVANSLSMSERRPATWRVYAQRFLDIRESLATTLLKLERAATSYFQGATARSLFGDTLSEEQWRAARTAAGSMPHLPLTAVDEWGLSSETQRQGSNTGQTLQSTNLASDFALRRYASFSKAIHDYIQSADNFLKTAEAILHVHGFVGRNPQSKAQILATAESRLDYAESDLPLSKYNLFQTMTTMSSMQDAFREWVGALVDPKRLAQVERRERALFPELWALWYQFCHSPEKRLSAPGQHSQTEFENALAASRSDLQRALHIGGNTRSTIQSEGLLWESRPALVLLLNLERLEQLEEGRVEILATLARTLGGHGPGTLRQYAQEYYWSNILIVPSVGSQAIASGAWVVPSFALSPEDRDAELGQPWLKPLHSVTPEQMRQFGLTPPATEIPGLEELQLSLAQLQLLYSHLGSFGELVARLDETGRQVLGRYLTVASRELGRLTETVLRLLPAIGRAASELTGMDAALVKVLLGQLLDLQEDLECGGSGTITRSVSDCKTEATRIEERRASIVAISLLARQSLNRY